MTERRRLLVLAVLGFAALGTPKAALGVAWPSVAGDLERGLADLGTLLAVYVAGYFVSSLLNGELTRRWGIGTMLVASGGLASVSLLGYAATPSWVLLVGAALGLGLSGGLIDAGLNGYVALSHGPRAMGLLHAGFGVGSTLGPLLMTGLLATGTSWRAGYAVLTAVQVALTAWFVQTRPAWDRAAAPQPAAPRPAAANRPLLAAALAVFVLYTGVELGAGQWAFTLFTEGRGMSDGSAGLVVTGYWASLTGGRVALGLLGDRADPHRLVSAGALVGAAGLLALWWNPAPWAGPAGLLVAGVGFAPIFPLQMLLTPARLGRAYAPWAVGYQLAAANVGAALIPGGMGLAVARLGVPVVGPVLAGGAVGLVAVTALLRRLSPG